MKYNIKIAKIGRKWIEANVNGVKSNYTAQIEKVSLPGVAVGDEMTVTATFVDHSSRYGKKYELVIISEEENIADEARVKAEIIDKWYGYIVESYDDGRGHIYYKGISKLHELGDHSHDDEIAEMEKVVDARKAAEKAEREREYAEAREARKAAREAAQRAEDAKYKHVLRGIPDDRYVPRPKAGEVFIDRGRVYEVVDCTYSPCDGMSFGTMTERFWDIRANDITETEDGMKMLAADEAERKEQAARTAERKAREATIAALEEEAEKKGVYPEKWFEIPEDAEIVMDTLYKQRRGKKIAVSGKTMYFVSEDIFEMDWANCYPHGICHCVEINERIEHELAKLGYTCKDAAIIDA